MKIVSCHIENFGRLHDYSVDFRDGVNLICQENGWGKSTFAAFLRAMFYGLEGERKRSVEENERKRYSPWQGGVFGGQLTFFVNGKQYTVSRVFGEKEASDRFEIRDAATNLPTADYTKRLGEEIFQIDRNSFMRTIFIGQNGCETASTDDINAKIGNLVDNSNDLNNFEAAMGRLTEVINRLTPSRATGSIAKRENEITRLEKILQDGRGISDSIGAYQGYLKTESETYERLKEQIREAGEQQAEAAKIRDSMAKKAQWERLKKTAESTQRELEEAKGRFPGEIPSSEEIKEQLSTYSRMEKAAERVSLWKLTDSENRELEDLQSSFAQEIPEDAEIDSMLELDQKLRRLRQETAAARLNGEEKRRLEALGRDFGEDSQGVSAVTAKWNQRNARKAALPSNQAAAAALRASVTSRRQGRRGMILLAVLGVMLILAGGITAALTKYLIAGAAAAVCGIVLLAFGLAGGRHKARQAEGMLPELAALEEAIEEDILSIERADEETAAYLSAHGKEYDEFTVSFSLQEIAEEYMEYTALRKKARRAAEFEESADMDSIRGRIARFLEGFGVRSEETGFTDDLYQLKQDLKKYQSLGDKKQKLREAEDAYQSAYEEICGFLERYGLTPGENLGSRLNDVRDHAEAYRAALKPAEEAALELKKFEEETDTSELKRDFSEKELPSPEELNQRILELTERMEKSRNVLAEYNRALERLQEQFDEWGESGRRLEEERETQRKEREKYGHVWKARDYLSRAKESMTAKYVDPILESFSRYYEMITDNSAGKFHVDANTSVTVDELGMPRETNTLSAGYRDLIGICLRVALVDAMYKKETPLLIMDDPFTNLDDKKLRLGKEFLERIAQKYQVIYFTCNSARNIEDASL